MYGKAWAVGWGQSQLCPRGSSAVGLSLSHTDNQLWGRCFMSSSLSYHICQKGRNTQTCLCCGRALGRCWDYMMGGNFPWFSPDLRVVGLCVWPHLLNLGSLGPLRLSLPVPEALLGCLFLHIRVLSPLCVASLDASDAPTPEVLISWSWVQPGLGIYFFNCFY